MNWQERRVTSLKDLSVGRKVIAAFVLVLLATIALGSVALLRLSTVKAAGDQVYVQGLPRALALGDIQLKISRYRIRQASSIIPGFSVNGKPGKVALDELAVSVGKAFKHYRELLTAPEEIETATKIENAWLQYRAMDKTLFAINQSQGQSEAVKYLFKGMGNPYQGLVDMCKAANADNQMKMGGQFAFAQSEYDMARILIVAFLTLALALSAASGFWLVRSVSSPLNRLTEVVGAMAGGRRDVAIPHAEQKDEIGKLAGSVASFNKQLVAAEQAKEAQTREIISSIGAGLDHLAKGDLTHRVTANLEGAFVKLKDDFNLAMTRLHDTMKTVLSTSGEIANGAGEISTAAEDLSHRTEQQAASLEETAAALDEITATVKMTATNAKNASLDVANTRASAEGGGRVVETAIHAMDEIAQSSKQITDIIGVIDEIAFQTNLLALNAGVEAARAGEAGKGFAVVASEVRALAQRSSEAAKQIKALINASGDHVANGVKYVGETGEALKKIVSQVEGINALVAEIAKAAEQQATGIQEVNAAVGQMDQVTQQNAAMVEQSTAASRSLAGDTQRLSELVGFFSVEDTASLPLPRTEAANPPAAVNSTRRPQARFANSGGSAVTPLRRAGAANTDAGQDWLEF
jgi:methyl-accepting chemotaxis protein